MRHEAKSFWIKVQIYSTYNPFELYIQYINSGMNNYRKLSNVRRIKSQTLNVSRFGLQFSLRNILKPSITWRMKMWLEQRRQAMLQLHLSDQQFNCLLKCDLY